MGFWKNDGEDRPKCPLIGAECIRSKCAFWTHMTGKSPQTGADVDEYRCVVTWLPILLVENAQKTRQGTAAVESFRNEMSQPSIVHRRIAAGLEKISELVKKSLALRGEGEPRIMVEKENP